MKPKFGLKMENKNFLLDDQFSRIQEFKPYLEFGNRLRLGLGYCWLPDNHHYLPNNDSMYINIAKNNGGKNIASNTRKNGKRGLSLL